MPDIDRDRLRPLFDPAISLEQQLDIANHSREYYVTAGLQPDEYDGIIAQIAELAEEVVPGLYPEGAIHAVWEEWSREIATGRRISGKFFLLMNPGLHPAALIDLTWTSGYVFKNEGYKIVLQHNPAASFLIDSNLLGDYWKFAFASLFLASKDRFVIPLNNVFITFSQENAMLFLAETFAGNSKLPLDDAGRLPAYVSFEDKSSLTLDDLLSAKTHAEQRAIAAKFFPRIRTAQSVDEERSAYLLARLMVHERPVNLHLLDSVLKQRFGIHNMFGVNKKKTPLAFAAEMTRTALLLQKMAPEIAHVPPWFLKATGFDLSDVPPLPTPRVRRSRKETG